MTEDNKKQHPGTGAAHNVVQSTSVDSIALIDRKRQYLEDLKLGLENLLTVEWIQSVTDADNIHLEALEALNDKKEQERKDNGTGRLTPAQNDKYRLEQKAIDKRHTALMSELRARKNFRKKTLETEIRKLEREIDKLEKMAVKTRDANITEMNRIAKESNGRSDRITFMLYPDSAPADWRSRLENTGVAIAVSPFHNRDIDRGKTEPKKAHWHVMALYEAPVLKSSAFLTFARALEGPNGPEAVKKILDIKSLNGLYDYLTHDTDKARADGKAKYDPKDILLFNGFEELYEQKLNEGKLVPVKDAVIDLILDKRFMSVTEMLLYVRDNEDELPITYQEVKDHMRQWSYTWDRICNGAISAPYTPPSGSVATSDFMPPRDSVLTSEASDKEQGE